MIVPVQHWRFFDFVQGRNFVDEWVVNDLSEAGRLAMNAMLKNVVKIENQLEWGARYLKGVAKKETILELKFIADKKQYRIAFIFQPGREVVLLIGFYHQAKIYHPSNALKTARKRAKDLRDNKSAKTERKIRFDL